VSPLLQQDNTQQLLPQVDVGNHQADLKPPNHHFHGEIQVGSIPVGISARKWENLEIVGNTESIHISMLDTLDGASFLGV